MNLPQFPDDYIPASPEARRRLIAWGEECARMGAEAPVAVLRKVLRAESHKRLAEREIAWPNQIDQNHKGYRKLMEMYLRLNREALTEARGIVAAIDAARVDEGRE